MGVHHLGCTKCAELKHYPIDEIHELHTQLAELREALNCAEAKVLVLSKRKPTTEEANAAELLHGQMGRASVDGHSGRRCTSCLCWVWDGGAMHLRCVLASNADFQFSKAKKAHEEAQHLVRKLSDVLLCLELREP